MSDELEIRLGPPKKRRPSSSAQTPAVRVPRRVLRQIHTYVSQNVSVESGGVLVGRFSERDNAVQISGQISADHAHATRDSLTFTHETWVAIEDTLDAEFPGQQIVGWYHSHPNFGIFLSSHDRFIQTNFFSAPWHLAYVADPIRKENGFFGWQAGEIVPIAQWNLADDTTAADTTPTTHSRRSTRNSPSRCHRRALAPALLAVSSAMLIAGIWLLVSADSGPATTAVTTDTTGRIGEVVSTTETDRTTTGAPPTSVTSTTAGQPSTSAPPTTAIAGTGSPWQTQNLATPSNGFAIALAGSLPSAPPCPADVELWVQRVEQVPVVVRRAGDELRFDTTCDPRECESFVGIGRGIPWDLGSGQLESCDGSGQTVPLDSSITAVATVPETGVLTWTTAQGLGTVGRIDGLGTSTPPLLDMTKLASDCSTDPDRAVGPQCATLVGVADNTNAVVARSDAGAPLVVAGGRQLDPCDGTSGWSWTNESVAVPIGTGQVLFIRRADGTAQAQLGIVSGASTSSAPTCSLEIFGAGS